MKKVAFSTLLFLALNFCFAKEFHQEVIPQFHLNSVHIHHVNGCKHVHGNNDTITTHYTTVDKKSKQKRDKVPLSQPFDVTFDCKFGTKKQCDMVEDGVKYIQDLFGSLFDFYEPVKVSIILSQDEPQDYIAFTELPIYYPLKNPDDKIAYSYPAPLAKQLNTDIPIDFDKNSDHDIAITISRFFLKGNANIVPTMIHELLHGFGFSVQIRIVRGGKIGEKFPSFGGNYFMPGLLTIDDKIEGKTVIKGFLPLSVYEKNFVDMDNQSYYFDDSFSNLNDVSIEYDLHKPMYFYEEEELQNLSKDLEKWSGMATGIHFYERSHEPKSVAFKTIDGKLIPLCTYENSADPDLCHLASPNFKYESPDKIEKQGDVDHNFILYRNNVGLNMSTEDKIKKFGNGKTVGLISEDIISALETMGYHRKGTPPDNTVYTVVSQIVKTSKSYTKGEEGTDKDISEASKKSNDDESIAHLRSTQSIVYVLLFAFCSIFALY